MALQEHVYPLTLDNLPTSIDSDPNGNVLFYCEQHGWLVANYEEATDCLTENNCTHWTYLPLPPR
jgi:hypothetical protein